MLISFVVAMDKKRLIGSGDTLPWHLPADMKRFRAITMGKPVIMGRKTYESIPKRFRPLAGRHNIVLTRNRNYSAQGCTIVFSVEDALSAAGQVDEIIIGGGAHLYAQLLPRAHRLYLTKIDAEFEGNVYFPEIIWEEWSEIHREERSADEQNPYDTCFVILERAEQRARPVQNV